MHAGRSFRITKPDDIDLMVDALRSTPAYAGAEDMTILISSGVCVVQTITAFSAEAFRLHQVIAEDKVWPWPGCWYDQPAVFARAREAIMDEMGRLTRQAEPKHG